jgi:hypothetical protein
MSEHVCLPSIAAALTISLLPGLRAECRLQIDRQTTVNSRQCLITLVLFCLYLRSPASTHGIRLGIRLSLTANAGTARYSLLSKEGSFEDLS